MGVPFPMEVFTVLRVCFGKRRLYILYNVGVGVLIV
jgi:hypothetical protein